MLKTHQPPAASRLLHRGCFAAISRPSAAVDDRGSAAAATDRPIAAASRHVRSSKRAVLKSTNRPLLRGSFAVATCRPPRGFRPPSIASSAAAAADRAAIAASRRVRSLKTRGAEKHRTGFRGLSFAATASRQLRGGIGPSAAVDQGLRLAARGLVMVDAVEAFGAFASIRGLRPPSIEAFGRRRRLAFGRRPVTPLDKLINSFTPATWFLLRRVWRNWFCDHR